MRFRWPRFWVDNFDGFKYHLSWQERRRLVFDRLDGSGFGYWLVLVAAIGFLTDAYDIFAINTVIPMLGIVYWPGGTIAANLQFALNAATLLGAMVGMLMFGVLADKYGRRKMYGLELVVTITASLGFASASSGVNDSMSIFAWLIFWRIVMGIGIGADYPLSAVITSEFAPTRYRARMIAAVFFCQCIGQLLATTFALAATEGFQSQIAHDGNLTSCSIFTNIFLDPSGANCAQTVDRVWRLVAGLGAVPAAIAILFRLTIPESVYWVLDVKNDSNQAMQSRAYWPLPSSRIDLEFNDDDSIQLDDIPQDDGQGTNHAAIQSSNNMPTHHQAASADPDNFVTLGPPANEIPGNSVDDLNQNHTSLEDPDPPKQSFQDFKNFFWTEGNWTDLLAASLNWLVLDFTFYLLGINNTSKIIPNMFDTKAIDSPFYTLVNNDRNSLIATSIGAVVGGAIAVKIMNNFSRKRIQMWCFLILAVLFPVVGGLYITLLKTPARTAIVAVYILCQLFYNLGPNTTTFIIPAESFPTRYRCTCHGIAAASGKLGSVLGQVLLTTVLKDTAGTDDPAGQQDQQNQKVGYMLIAFAAVMGIGAATTKFITPETCDIWGKSRSLQDLSLGKKHRKKLELAEREQQRRSSRN